MELDLSLPFDNMTWDERDRPIGGAISGLVSYVSSDPGIGETLFAFSNKKADIAAYRVKKEKWELIDQVINNKPTWSNMPFKMNPTTAMVMYKR